MSELAHHLNLSVTSAHSFEEEEEGDPTTFNQNLMFTYITYATSQWLLFRLAILLAYRLSFTRFTIAALPSLSLPLPSFLAVSSEI